ncbi:fukutin-related protein isoform X2 [Contarinia nasturtii]|uniref:fukutin-related protein isoform X1 n=1 Tax=Contarinia nasturtii TaxID=265458 RepID=UPI0012D4940A|nr:fukutin-related protein isoform X1 [Contarinia nasturtii]XP_031620718.1 fukutin-related protein isoform X2 [Contarinia nasturtii]
MVRLKYAKLLTILVFIVNVILFLYTWKWFVSESNNYSTTVQTKLLKIKDRAHSTNKHIKKLITIVFRDFYHFENDLQHSIDSILNQIPNIQIMVLYEDEPYPPLNFVKNYTATHSNVKFINLNFDIRKTSKALSPLSQIRTKYVLFTPDSFRFGGRAIIQKILAEIEKKSNRKNVANSRNTDIDASSSDQNINIDSLAKNDNSKSIIIIPFVSNVASMSNCCRINIDIANWTMEYISIKNSIHQCDMFLQKHAILADTSLLKIMPDALASPFPEMFYIQAKICKAKLHFLKTGLLQDGKRLFTAFHNKQRRKEIRKQQFKNMYKKIQIKKVVRKYRGKINDRHNKQHEKKATRDIFGNAMPAIVLSNVSIPILINTEYFGCEKNTRSCIGTVFRKPFYVYLKRNTPPCCLEKLKSVFYHVLEELTNVGIRYWLDNVALKSAIETSELARDAFEIDISFISYDLDRSTLLKKAQTRPVIDNLGFYWIKATEGQYFRVQYSKQNQVGVNLLPFSMIGERVRANGFFGWKAKEFSAEFLHPMSTVIFLNKNVMTVNNVCDFLSLKNIT